MIACGSFYSGHTIHPDSRPAGGGVTQVPSARVAADPRVLSAPQGAPLGLRAAQGAKYSQRPREEEATGGDRSERDPETDCVMS